MLFYKEFNKYDNLITSKTTFEISKNVTYFEDDILRWKDKLFSYYANK